MKLHLGKRTLAGLAAAMVVVLAVIAAAWHAAARLEQIQSRVARSHEVLAQLSDTLSDLQDVETGGRGFIITGEETFLEPYHAALQRVEAGMVRLKTLVADQPAQARRGQALAAPIAARIAITKENITVRREQGFAAAQQMVLAGKGRQAMDEARTLVTEMAREENRLLGQRLQEEDAAEQRVFAAFVLAGATCIGLLLGIGWLLNRDVRARELAAAQLRTSEARWRNIFAQASDGIFLLTADNRYLDANVRGCEMLGYTRTELLRLKVADVLAPAEIARLKIEPVEMMSGKPHLAEWEHRRKDGTFFPAEVSARRLDENSYLAIVRDLTTRKLAEAELRKSFSTLELFIDSVPHFIAFVDTEEKYQLVNHNYEAWFARPRSQILGRPLRQLHRAGTYAMMAPHVRRALAGQPTSYENRMTGRDGKEYCFDVRLLPRHAPDGKVLGYFVLALDVTAGKLAEEAQRALNARLQAVREEERTRIARELHDELGQALTGLKFDLAWLDRKLGQPGPAETAAAARAKAAAMTQAVDATIHLVRRIASELRPGVLDALGLVAALEWQAQEFEQRTGIRCITELPDPTPALAEGHATALFRIFQEALTNVARHAQARRVTVTLTEPAETVELKIADDGQGIADVNVAGTKSLGLLGMRERAAAAGGTMELRSAVGQGTAVVVRLPKS